MDCPEFLEWYSDYRDGLITEQHLRRRLRAHLAACAACRRYDASLRQGIRALREGLDIDPSPGFEARLRARLATAATERLEPVTPGAAGTAAALMLAAAVALLVYHAARAEHPKVTAGPLTAVAEDKPRPMIVVNPGVPFVTFTDLSVSPFQTGPSASNVRVYGDIPLGTWANLPR